LSSVQVIGDTCCIFIAKTLIAGNFGSCLADHLGDITHDVYMWSRDADLVETFNREHRNPTYLKDHQFSKNITAVGPELPSAEMLDSAYPLNLVENLILIVAYC